MDQLTQMIGALRADPLLAGGVGGALSVAWFLLRRRPKMQREADERLSALRRDTSDRYTKLRPPR